jgi:hypothetical protein
MGCDVMRELLTQLIVREEKYYARTYKSESQVIALHKLWMSFEEKKEALDAFCNELQEKYEEAPLEAFRGAIIREVHEGGSYGL